MYHRHSNIISSICVALVLIATIGFFGCAPKTRVLRTQAAEVSVGGIRTLALLSFEGRYGEAVRSDFYNKLGEVEHFNLIDTTHVSNLDKIIYDQVDDPRFFPVLEDLHADGVITGRVSANINDIRGTDQVEMEEGTGQYKKKKNIFGKKVDVEIKRTVLKPVDYVIRQASLTTAFKVFDLRTKQIVTTGKVTKNYNEKFGGDREYALFNKKKLSQLPAKNQTVNELSARVAAALVAKIAPTRSSIVVKFDDGSKFGLGLGGHKLVKQGIEFAKRGVWEKAMDIWQEVIRNEPDNAPAYYNLGLAYESFGDLENLMKASKMYDKAITYKDNKLYIDAIARIKNAIKDRQRYEKQRELLEKTPVKKRRDQGGVRIY